MQKHNFGLTCPVALFVEFILVPPEHEKRCIDVSCLGHTGMDYVTHRSHGMQNHKFSVTCDGALFVESTQGPPKQEK
jgi:hypothetical protein